MVEGYKNNRIQNILFIHHKGYQTHGATTGMNSISLIKSACDREVES